MLELRWLAAIVLTVPLLLAAGVYWLHHLPVGVHPPANDNVIEVRLMGRQPDAGDRREALQAPTEPQARTLIDDAPGATSEPVVTSTSAESEQAASRRSAAAASATSRVTLDRQLAEFQRTLLTHIARFRRYPEKARRNRAYGSVQLLFMMQHDGTVTNVKVASSSGDSLLDTAAIETIIRAQPMPSIPSGLPQQLSIFVPVVFDSPQ